MPDLSTELIAWERPGHDPVVGRGDARPRHRRGRRPPRDALGRATAATQPGLGLRRGVRCPSACSLLTRAGGRALPRRGRPGRRDRFLAGWDAFDRLAPAGREGPARRGSGADPAPLLAALGRLPAAGLHGDLKLANVALLDDGRVALIDWQMMRLAPVAVELGWLLVSNSAELPIAPDDVLERYREVDRLARRPPGARRRPRPARLSPRPRPTIGDWDAQRDLTWIVGLLMRGWRKGLDAEAGLTLGSGVAAADDLAWWCARAVEAAGRRLP